MEKLELTITRWLSVRAEGRTALTVLALLALLWGRGVRPVDLSLAPSGARYSILRQSRYLCLDASTLDECTKSKCASKNVKDFNGSKGQSQILNLDAGAAGVAARRYFKDVAPSSSSRSSSSLSWGLDCL